MNARFAGILVVLLVVLGGGALLYQRQQSAQRPDSAATIGKPLFPELKVAEIAQIRVLQPKETLTLKRAEDGWNVAERGEFPADVSRVREFVLKAIGLKVSQSEPIGEKDRARFNLDHPSSGGTGTLIEFAGADGKTLASVVVGKKYFKREVDNPERANADGRYVALLGQPSTVYLVGDPLTQATTRSAEWIDRASFQVEKVKTLEVRFAAGGGWRIERKADNADWRLAGLGAGEKLDVSRANAASYSLQLLELADVAPKGVTDTGLDKPTRIDATTLAGASYTINVGKLAGENHYVSFTSSATDKPREKVLAAHVLLVPKSKLEDTLRPRAELLEKKAAKK